MAQMLHTADMLCGHVQDESERAALRANFQTQLVIQLRLAGQFLQTVDKEAKS